MGVKEEGENEKTRKNGNSSCHAGRRGQQGRVRGQDEAGKGNGQAREGVACSGKGGGSGWEGSCEQLVDRIIGATGHWSVGGD